MDAVVAIPTKNEAERIGACLRALDAQTGGHSVRVLLLLNDCNDGTADVVRAMRPGLGVPIDIVECHAGPGQSGAGFARRMAMQRAAEVMARAGAGQAALLTTDADGRPDPDWVAGNLRGLRAGADAVAGQAVIDPVEARLIPQRLHDADARECAYADRLDHIAALVDPDPADPWPRHTEHSGASMAVTQAAYHRVGGIPPVALGEDRAFFAALRRIDARIRHMPGLRVIVSGRIHGRAAGGMADTIRRRMVWPDPELDDRLEPAGDALRRVRLRRMARLVWRGGGDRWGGSPLAARLGIGASDLTALLRRRHFGDAFDAIEASSPVLRRRAVPTAALAVELDRAGRILAAIADVRPPLGLLRLLSRPAESALQLQSD